MSYHTVEGTWEEVMTHVDEFVGHRVRVIVLDDEEKQTKNLAKMLEGKTGTLRLNAPYPASRASETFTDILVEKDRRTQS